MQTIRTSIILTLQGYSMSDVVCRWCRRPILCPERSCGCYRIPPGRLAQLAGLVLVLVFVTVASAFWVANLIQESR